MLGPRPRPGVARLRARPLGDRKETPHLASSIGDQSARRIAPRGTAPAAPPDRLSAWWWPCGALDDVSTSPGVHGRSAASKLSSEDGSRPLLRQERDLPRAPARLFHVNPVGAAENQLLRGRGRPEGPLPSLHARHYTVPPYRSDPLAVPPASASGRRSGAVREPRTQLSRRAFRRQPNIRTTSSRHPDVLSRRRALEVPAEAVADLVGADDRLATVALNGASRTRTDDLSAASRTLSQLSYSPRKLVVGGPV